MNRNLVFYILVIGIFGLLLWFIFNQGKQLEAERYNQANLAERTPEEVAAPDDHGEAKSPGAAFSFFLEDFVHNLTHPLSILLLQITTIVLFSRLLGFLFGKIGQPTVIGEIIAGLKTQVGLLNEGNLWLVCGLIIVVAVAGKFGGSLIAAKFTGQSWSDSLAIGVLMNTRGLMELIVLNIGYDLGILTPTVFTMMVLMALVTTFITCPVLALIEYCSRRREVLDVKPLPEKSL